MSNCNSCPSKGKCNNKENCMVENNPLNKVKNVIAVMSGKGGVGKSTVSTLLARQLKAMGYSVGLLDGDITGPSIPRMMGLESVNLKVDEAGMHPALTKDGIYVMSMNLLTQFEEQAVIWRGPMIASAVKQFWTDVIWGELDFLVIDMPPGTGDVPLTVLQSMPITGVVLVSTPQDLVSMIVAKAVNMAEKMGVKVFGVVENMSYILCPDCNRRIELFGEGRALEASKKVGTKLLGELPMNTNIMGISRELGIQADKGIENTFKDIVNGILEQI